MPIENVFSRVKAAIGSLKGDLSSIEKSIVKEQAEIERLQGSPPPRDDIKQLLVEVLAGRAAKGREILTQSLRYAQTHPMQLAGDRRDIEPRMSILTANRPDHQVSVQSLELALAGLLESQLQEAIEKFIDSVPWPQEAGPPIADRGRLIADAEKRLAKAVGERDELRRAAAQSGVLI